MLSTKELLLQQIDINIPTLPKQVLLAQTYNVSEEIIKLYRRSIELFRRVRASVLDQEIPERYLLSLTEGINAIIQNFRFHNLPPGFDILSNYPDIKGDMERDLPFLQGALIPLELNFTTFEKLGFLSKGLVAIGANGSGKTNLSNELKKGLPNQSIIISAQKFLVIPNFSGVANFNDTIQKLRSSQFADKSTRFSYASNNISNSYQQLTELASEYQILLDNLLAERSGVRNKYVNQIKKGILGVAVPETNLDKAITIWNFLIKHRLLDCDDGVNITLRQKGQSLEYPANQMSDGEKAVLYFVAQVLQAPANGYVIVDEPETFLHKTIVKKLWDTLENERNDCTFIYLTHDLDFAASRVSANKFWIKSFTYPTDWEIEKIPENELPESLLFELLGSRKNILFCEGQKGSVDEKLYSILFPNFTITPVESCLDVIKYTKAFNRLPNLSTKALGVIDSDHSPFSRLTHLEAENIFSCQMAEVENILFNEQFLAVVAEHLYVDKQNIEQIKLSVIQNLSKDKESQTSHYVSAKINYYFNDSHVSKGNTLANVQDNYATFVNQVKIQEWYDTRIGLIEQIIKSDNYSEAIKIYNNKGLRAIANRHFKISDFIERAIKILQRDEYAGEIIKNHFPIRLLNQHQDFSSVDLSMPSTIM